MVANHLYKLTVERSDGPLNDSFPDEQLLAISMNQAPWFTDIANYLTSGIMAHDLSTHQKKKFFHDVKHYFWDEPFFTSCVRMRFTDVASLRRRLKV